MKPQKLELKGMDAAGKAALIEHDGGLIEVYGSGRKELAAKLVKRYNQHESLVEQLERCREYLHTKYPKEASIFADIEAAISGVETYTADNKRGSGRTKTAMMNAPKGAIYLWCNEILDYPIRLAKSIGREDLIIFRPSKIESMPRLPVKALVVDHACYEPGMLSHRQHDYLDALRRALAERESAK